MTLANISFDQDRTILATKAKPSFVVGGLVNLPIAGRLSLQVEGLYARRVIEFEGFIEDTLTYLEVPMLLRYAALRKTGWRVHALGGVVYSRLLKAEELVIEPPDDIKDIMEPNELAVSIGADFEWRGSGSSTSAISTACPKSTRSPARCSPPSRRSSR